MRIQIHDRGELEKQAVSGFLPNTSVISITDVNEEPVKLAHSPRYLLELSFDDISSESDVFNDSRRMALNLYSKEQAEQLADFVYEHKNETENIICQCRWGYSRSAAVAAALKEHFYNDGMEIILDERYYPNIYVFRQTLQALNRISGKAGGKMNVTVCSRKAVEELFQKGFPEHTAAISFYDPETSYHRGTDYQPVDYSGKAERLFQVPIHDIDLSVLPEFGLTYDKYFPEADRLAEFIYSAKLDGLNILCQCEYGESRSSGCAAAILEHFYKTGITIFADYRYYPNQVVYHKVLGALEKYKKENFVQED